MTLAECCFDAGLGVDVQIAASVVRDAPGFEDIATVFGESASRVVVSVASAQAEKLLQLAARDGVPACIIGRVGGDRIRLSVDGRPVIDEPVDELETLWGTAIEQHFEPREIVA